jgi:subtilisin
MTEDLATRPRETTGRYLVLLPEEETSSGISALSDSSGVPASDMSVYSNLGVAVVTLDPERLQSVRAAVAGDAPLLGIEPEQILYALGDSSMSEHTANYLRGYKDGVTHLVDSLTGATVAEDRQLSTAAFADGSATWGLQATKVVGSRYSGAGIKIAVLDTGLDLTHPDFVGRNITSKSFIAGEQVQDLVGHGTHCIGTACGRLNPPDPAAPMRYGIAHNAEIFAGKVLDNQGSGADGGILEGIDWAIANGCQIISMSLGAATVPGEAFSRIYERAARRALSQGTLIIAAAGNESRNRFTGKRRVPPNPVDRPANCPSIMAVAAIDKMFQVAAFSNSSINTNGGSIDIAAPGVDIYSTYSTNTIRQILPDGSIDPNPSARYQRLNGTSMATPHVAGIAALYAESTGKRGLELWTILLQNALRLNLASADVGAGLVQAP